ncbi:UNVERIFIED_CONTAM: dense granule protein GRA5 [Hammondia hammondi]|eukprot:XP_008884114.1 dense granule protein GRA5 [Hammondia hammondi]
MASVKRIVVAVMIVNVLALIFVGVAGLEREIGSREDNSQGGGGGEQQQQQPLQHESQQEPHDGEDQSLLDRGRAAVTGHPVRTVVGLAAAVLALVSLLRFMKKRKRRVVQEESKESATAEDEEVVEEEE